MRQNGIKYFQCRVSAELELELRERKEKKKKNEMTRELVYLCSSKEPHVFTQVSGRALSPSSRHVLRSGQGGPNRPLVRRDIL